MTLFLLDYILSSIKFLAWLWSTVPDLFIICGIINVYGIISYMTYNQIYVLCMFSLNHTGLLECVIYTKLDVDV